MNRITMLCSGFFALLVATTLWEVGEAVAQDPAAAGQRPDLSARMVVDARVDEPLEAALLLVQDTQCRVPGAGQLSSGFNHPRQHAVRV